MSDALFWHKVCTQLIIKNVFPLFFLCRTFLKLQTQRKKLHKSLQRARFNMMLPYAGYWKKSKQKKVYYTDTAPTTSEQHCSYIGMHKCIGIFKLYSLLRMRRMRCCDASAHAKLTGCSKITLCEPRRTHMCCKRQINRHALHWLLYLCILTTTTTTESQSQSIII